jgi:hypothetical protein
MEEFHGKRTSIVTRAGAQFTGERRIGTVRHADIQLVDRERCKYLLVDDRCEPIGVSNQPKLIQL